MVNIMRVHFNKHRVMYVVITENQLVLRELVEEVTKPVEMNYPETLESRHASQSVDDFSYLWEEMGSTKKPITKDAVEGFSEPATSVSEHPARKSGPDLRSINSLRSSRKFFDRSIHFSDHVFFSVF